MKKALLSAFVFAIIIQLAYAAKNSEPNSEYYGTGLCAKPGYTCVTVKKGETWNKLFPNETQLDVVQRINRTDMQLWSGKQIAVPNNLENTSIYDASPFPLEIGKQETRVIVVDQEKLAWGAYDESGHLVKWGPISSGKDYCSDIKKSCNTKTGVFYLFNKEGAKCKSRIFPIGKGGAIMPYCMYFFQGYALHGSLEVRGYRDSHGCVRLFTRDAKWLNEEFVNLRQPEGDKGTKVIVKPLNTTE